MDRVTGQETWATAPWTARATAPPRRNRERRAGCGRAGWAALFLLFGFVALFPPFLRSAGAEDDTVLSESGIRYPGGFDPNTVGEVQGTATGLIRPESGPVRFHLHSDRDEYTVLTGPAWYWSDLSIELPDGTPVRVQGSKSLGRDGNLYIIAQEMETPRTRKFFFFRDEGGFPLWKGSGAGRTGHGIGMGSPMGGHGGTGGGHGGGTRGHR